MQPHPPGLRTSRPGVREARRQLLEAGCVTDGLIDPAVRRSWERSHRFGLAPTGRPAGAPHASAAQLSRALERQRELASHARPAMEFLFHQTQGSGSMVILADAEGTLLHALGDAGFADRAQRVALRPGANWLEQWRGTNAIGTALAEAGPVVVHGGEHFLERNAFLTCAAVPIVDAGGRVIGVLDISGDCRGYHPHTLALVRLAVRSIERNLFESRYAASTRLRLHRTPEGIGSVEEGLLALSGDGRPQGANEAALAMLGISRAQLAAVTMDGLFEGALRPGAQTLAQMAPRALRLQDGSVLWARIEGMPAAPRAPAVRAGGLQADPRDALAGLQSGDAATQAVVDRARRILDKPIPLLLRGESGVGKEVFARAFHASSGRAAGSFVAVNCAALPEALIESELFGYRAGAFTGACRDGAPGRIREAHGGTLFLDEVGDMPPALQARLLRVLQDGQVQPLGGGQPVPADFRLLCATHRDLRVEIAQGRFREDLYYRINGLTLELPPLRERRDLPQLVARMLQALVPGRDLHLAPELSAAFVRHRWPGNLRQLHRVLQTACALMADAETEISWPHLCDDLAQELRGAAAQNDGDDAPADLRSRSEAAVRSAVRASAGNVAAAARALGISRNTLYRKLRELGLHPAQNIAV